MSMYSIIELADDELDDESNGNEIEAEIIPPYNHAELNQSILNRVNCLNNEFKLKY